MITKLKICTMAVALAGMASATHAADLYKFVPANSQFSATGSVFITDASVYLACSMTMSGTTGKATGLITNVSFGGASGCENIVAMALPWKFRPISLGSAQITHFNLNAVGVVRCGPNQTKATVANLPVGGGGGGSITIQTHLPSKTGVCDVNASLTSVPALSISGLIN